MGIFCGKPIWDKNENPPPACLLFEPRCRGTRAQVGGFASVSWCWTSWTVDPRQDGQVGLLSRDKMEIMLQEAGAEQVGQVVSRTSRRRKKKDSRRRKKKDSRRRKKKDSR